MFTGKIFYKGYKNTGKFEKFKTICAFGDAINIGLILMTMANNEQEQLAKKFQNLSARLQHQILT